MKLDLRKRQANGGQVEGLGDKKFSFTLPPTPSGKYALAQVDDYMHLRRGQFLHHPPVSLQLEARVSGHGLPGTWGFGFWNDPFSAGFGAGGMRRVLPVLPNAAWFFYGSDPNHLSLREGSPGSGFHAKVFQSPRLPAFLSPLALPIAPFLLWPSAARILRRLARILVKEDAAAISVDVTEMHHYQLQVREQGVVFLVDHQPVFHSQLYPRGRLGLVIWIDNQYFKLTADGEFGLGFLSTSKVQVLDVQNLTLTKINGYD